MALEEKELVELEAAFPTLSGRAFSLARERTLDAGESVLQAEGGIIYQVSPDGQKVIVKEITKPKQVEVGTRFAIK